MSESIQGLTPLMQQYFEIKKEFPDSILLFQVGDFYELFFDDAKRASAFLAIALTKRGNVNGEPIPLCGVPLHAVDHYLEKLIKGGFKVVICDQLEEPTPGKIVKRGVKHVLSPGTLTDARLLDSKSASYILFFSQVDGELGLVFIEMLTGQLFATTMRTQDLKALDAELSRFFPAEVIVMPGQKDFLPFFKKYNYHCSMQELNQQQEAYDWLLTLENNETSGESLTQSLLLAYSYFKKNNAQVLAHIKELFVYTSEDFLIIDHATQKNLEIITNAIDNSYKNSLFELLDKAVTPMGSRMIKKWLLRPLVKIDAIHHRLDCVEKLVKEISLKDKLILLLKQMSDIERIVGRIALQKTQLHDYINLKNSLGVLPALKLLLDEVHDNKLFRSINVKISSFTQLSQLLEQALNDDAAKDWIIKTGFDNKLDYIRSLVLDSQKKILSLEQQEIEATGINSLKIRFNDVTGYYIEITKTHSDIVPDRYKRVQTLSNRERFTTSELKELELEIEKAKREIGAVEQELYNRVKYEVFGCVTELKKTAYAVAHVDALIALAEVAYHHNYVRPQFNADSIEIQAGRHPIVEQHVDSFIPNDTMLSQQQQVVILTGPNMGGKSTYLRQVAVISLMAQCGSFVSAQSANLKILDRIFTRIGAGDNLAEGKSTFLVEMEETATICKQATKNSLLILDEVGRGTSTFDGLAIAQSVLEYIYTTIGAYCLFATHYHELTHLEHSFESIVAYHAVCKKQNDKILFLHKIERGVAAGSFGIEVAKLAELPESIIERAKEILQNLTANENILITPSVVPAQKQHSADKTDIKHLVKNLAIENMTAREALDFLWNLQQKC